VSGRSFRSVFMVASCAAAALGCYMVSLRVASERAALEDVETEIVLAQRDLRLLQTEIGTRGRLAQLERWNVKVLALSAPSADQFVNGGFALAKMVAPVRKFDPAAPVVLASAPADVGKPRVDGAPVADTAQPVRTSDLMHVASLKTEPRPSSARMLEPAKPAAAAPPKIEAAKAAASAERPKAKAASKAPADTAKAPTRSASAKKPAAAATKTRQTASKKPDVDPLAPLKDSPRARTVASATTKGTIRKP